MKTLTKYLKIHDCLKHDRFKTLNERAKRGEELQKEADKAEKKRLEDEGKFKELNEKVTKENEALQQKLKDQSITNAIQNLAATNGVKDLEAANKLIDRSSIEVDDNGEVTGVEEAVKQLVEQRPYLKQGHTPMGSPSNPGDGNDGNGTGAKIKLSQVQDPEFFSKNEKEIDKALKEGNIEDDVN